MIKTSVKTPKIAKELVTMGTLGTVRTMGNGKNFYKNFDERREISKGAIGAIVTMGTRTMENGKTSVRTLMKVKKYP